MNRMMKTLPQLVQHTRNLQRVYSSEAQHAGMRLVVDKIATKLPNYMDISLDEMNPNLFSPYLNPEQKDLARLVRPGSMYHEIGHGLIALTEDLNFKSMGPTCIKTSNAGKGPAFVKLMMAGAAMETHLNGFHKKTMPSYAAKDVKQTYSRLAYDDQVNSMREAYKQYARHPVFHDTVADLKEAMAIIPKDTYRSWYHKLWQAHESSQANPLNLPADEHFFEDSYHVAKTMRELVDQLPAKTRSAFKKKLNDMNAVTEERIEKFQYTA